MASGDLRIASMTGFLVTLIIAGHDGRPYSAHASPG
jgi:hypothetical protein